MKKRTFLAKKLVMLLVGVAMSTCFASAQTKLDFTGFKQVFPDATDGSEYLYEATYKDYDYDAAVKITNFLCSEWTDSLLKSMAEDEVKKVMKLPYAGKADEKSSCCEVRKGKFFGRNLDGYYNPYANLLMHIDAGEDRLASIAMGRIETLGSKSAIDKGILPDFVLNAAPMFASDGINSAGVCVALNSLPRINLTRTTGTNPGKPRLCEALLPRVILDKAHNVEEALEIIRNNDIFAPYNPKLGVYRELHFMIADPNRTVVVEFFENNVYVQESDDVNNTDTTQVSDANIMTNMWHSQWDNDSLSQAGVERYKVLQNHYYDVPSETATADDIHNLLSTVWLSKTFYGHTKPYWITDNLWTVPWCDLKPGSTSEKGKQIRQNMYDLIEMISDACKPELLKTYRPATVEATLHSSVYDMEEKSLTLVPAQTDKKLYFKIESSNE